MESLRETAAGVGVSIPGMALVAGPDGDVAFASDSALTALGMPADGEPPAGLQVSAVIPGISWPDFQGEDRIDRLDVNRADGTAFPDRRAIMVKLMPGRAAGHTEIDNGDGTKTIAYDRIPGYIPAEGTGLFAGFYPSYDPSFDGGDQASRPDRFGHLSLTYTVPGSP